MTLKKYAFFTNGDNEAGANDALLLPVDNILGITIHQGPNKIGNTLDITGVEVGDEFHAKRAIVRVTHKAGRVREAMSQITEALSSNPKDGFIIFSQDKLKFSAGQNDVLTSISLILTE